MMGKMMIAGPLAALLMLGSGGSVIAGTLDSPGAPASGSNMVTMADIYDQLDTGATSNPSASFQEPAAGPGSTGRSLTEIEAKLPVPDNTNGATPADVAALKTFWGLRTDGSWGLQTGTYLDPASNTVLSAGQIWMDRNLGASQVATSSTDAAAYGDLYQWGRGADGHQLRGSGITATLSSTDTPVDGNFITVAAAPNDWRDPQNASLWQGVAGTNNPCPAGFRLPTEPESDTERTSWGSSGVAGAFGSPLKLVLAGGRGVLDGTLHSEGSTGYYWTSTVNGSYARSFHFSGVNDLQNSDVRAEGFSVRCLQD